MSKGIQGYTKPEIRTVGAGEILEVLGPVSAGSWTDGSDSECTLAYYMLGKPGC